MNARHCGESLGDLLSGLALAFPMWFPLLHARPKLLIAFARDSMRERESRANPRDRVSSRRNVANRTISRGIPTVRVHAVWREIVENARDSTR